MFVAVIIAFALFFITMSAGVMLGGKPLAGSCGGLAQAGLDGDCKICGKKPGSCDIGDGKASAPLKLPKVVNIMAEKKKNSFSDPLDF